MKSFIHKGFLNMKLYPWTASYFSQNSWRQGEPGSILDLCLETTVLDMSNSSHDG